MDTKSKEKKEQPFLSEKHILEKAYTPPVCLYTYKGGQRVEIQHVGRYEIRTSRGMLKKLELMFAFPAENFETIKSGIRINTDVKSENLTAIENIKKRPKVVTPEEVESGLHQNVRLVMRTGYVIRGVQVAYNRYNLLVRVNGKTVLVYIHGLFSYNVVPEKERQDKSTTQA